MNVIACDIEGPLILEPKVFGDARGFFLESWNAASFAEIGLDVTFVQDNHSRSQKGVLRGMHFQNPAPQGKLVRVVRGAVFDAIVDLRQSSPTFGQWTGVVLSAENKRMFWVPEGFAHGFLVLSDTATFFYKCDNFYNKESEGGILFNDSTIGVDWNFDTEKLIISEKDKFLPTLANAKKAW